MGSQLQLAQLLPCALLCHGSVEIVLHEVAHGSQKGPQGDIALAAGAGFRHMGFKFPVFGVRETEAGAQILQFGQK